MMMIALAAGGLAAYFLVIASPDEPENAGPAPSSEKSGPTASAPSRSETAPTETAPAEPNPAREDTVSAAEAAPNEEVASDYEAAEMVLRDHWTSIDEGEYERAFGAFHSTYSESVAGREWIENKRSEQPDIDLDSFEVQPQGTRRGDILMLSVDLVVADRGGKCAHFAGDVRMQLEEGRWTYRPGELKGVKPSFAAVRIPPSDERCTKVIS